MSALRCGHVFHLKCIKYWLNEQETCPECRKPTKLDEIFSSFYFHDDEDSKSTSDSYTESSSSNDSRDMADYNNLIEEVLTSAFF
ncbi:unnamed protein product [Thelazia callipaeda]|uniref:RING-type domain-containing protein n=1 Tax=Thelazia callipaeda TaxID=103827 RepID=A0A0N5D9S0_THECL|nr:unnamed protein product [Thelazia callipaeda]